MGVTERRAREKEALSEAILDAASELIVKEGPQNLSIRKIAEKIEYAPSTIYLYFEDKHAILAGICIRFFEDLLERLNQIRENTPDPAESLRAGLRCYIDFALQNPTRYQVAFLSVPTPELTPDHPICVAIHQAGFTALDCLGQGIGAAMEAGVIEPGDPVLKAFNTWLALHGLTAGIITMREYDATGWPDTDALVNGHVEMIMRGLGEIIVRN